MHSPLGFTFETKGHRSFFAQKNVKNAPMSLCFGPDF